MIELVTVTNSELPARIGLIVAAGGVVTRMAVERGRYELAVRWQFPLFSPDHDLDPAKLKQSNAGRKREHDPRKILKAIADTTPENGISVSAWARLAGINRITLTAYLSEMRKQGWIATAGEGTASRQFITEKGKEML